MKHVMILHINDGNSRVIKNEDRMLIESFPRAEAEIAKYVNDGWRVTQMIPEVSPAIPKEGSYSFYRSGFTLYLEKEE